ncbi:hypothetical protein Scel_18510 [Streptomyces cellostaticus]|nr:hypothetical protein Scel_18510 [Streptomyces cellostaticus]
MEVVRSTTVPTVAPQRLTPYRSSGGQLHLLTGRTGKGNPPFEPDSLRALVPDMTERDVYVCGAPAMTSAVLSALCRLEVPDRQVHAERFGLA